MVFPESCSKSLFWHERGGTQTTLSRRGCFSECDGCTGNSRRAHGDSAADLCGNRSSGFADQGVAGRCADDCALVGSRHAFYVWGEYWAGRLSAAYGRFSLAADASAGIFAAVAKRSGGGGFLYDCCHVEKQRAGYRLSRRDLPLVEGFGV